MRLNQGVLCINRLELFFEDWGIRGSVRLLKS